MTTASAYAACRGIARREAKNFYFAFLALPPRKRDAICAVYAFMRRADDISDDESQSKEQRRAQMRTWMNAWHEAAAHGGSTDPVFVALNDARLRFRIPLGLLDQLVEGTAMDLVGGSGEPEALSFEGAAGQQTFADFKALYGYCYLVASVVGLVCIRIFEYSSTQAEKLAEELGIGFQLTNILRDVREDAERGRVYLPVDELAAHGLSPETLMEAARSGKMPNAAVRAMLNEQAQRAERFYASGERLLPLIAADSRPALWVLMTIYHRLLQRIEQQQFDVFSSRARVKTSTKLWLLAQGLLQTLGARLFPAREKPTATAMQPQSLQKRVAVVGAGVAGLAASVALSDAGYHVTIFERRPYVGGRASSYLHPGSGEVIDNCQHILLGCCTNLRSLFARVGRSDAIAWTNAITYIEPGGRRSVVRPGWLPAPLQSSVSFLFARCFSLRDKLAIATGLRSFFRGYPQDVPGGESFLDWARRNGQTEGALKRFWEPILASALNDDLHRISMHYAGKVLRDSFMNSTEAGSIGVPLLPLSQMYAGAAAYVQSRGGQLELRTSITALQQVEKGWRLAVETPQGHVEQEFDDVVVALPFEAALRLVPSLPDDAARAALTADLASFEHVPLVGIHLWFDREITALPHAVLLDTTIQWMYQGSRSQHGASLEQQVPGQGQGNHLELVVSVARKLVPMSQAEIVELAVQELRLFFPEAAQARLVKAVVTKEIRATFAVTPGQDARRPGARTAWKGLYLAGDWTDTGWPATMEGAARSGFLAAEAVTGGTERFLVSDLPARGLMRWFS
jgi:squalene-associated FAD-dependent desaturase